ncbi:MAG: VPLPA-CTERM sorting domain-containing protein [Pseudomonadota bacterium]
MSATLAFGTTFNLGFFGASATLGGSGSELVVGGDFLLGGVSPQATFVVVNDDTFAIQLGTSIAAGATATGTLAATLDVETWAAIGTTGNVANELDVVGTYEIVAPTIVPLPATALLLLAGATALGVAARRRSA